MGTAREGEKKISFVFKDRTMSRLDRVAEVMECSRQQVVASLIRAADRALDKQANQVIAIEQGVEGLMDSVE